MTQLDIRCVPVSETSVMLYLADEIDVSLAPLIRRICRRIGEECQDVCELTPSYGSVLVQINTANGSLDELAQRLLEIVNIEHQQHNAELDRTGKRIELPVYYHPDVAPDLEGVAEAKGLSMDEVIEIHAGRDYTVCAIGFAPGFAFLADVDERIATPRHESPRAKVTAGSVGIAGKQTAVYPADTPGGWQLIGKCPVSLYDPREVPLSPFEVGDSVRFVPVGLTEFLERGGCV